MQYKQLYEVTPWGRALIEKLTIAQPVKHIPDSYRTHQ
jgi:hypothetical protein